jgi:hypothetical protein
MKKFLTMVALVGLVASSAGAIEVALHPMWENTGDKLDLVVSQTGVVSVYLNIGADDGNVGFMNAFFDASPLQDGSTAGYDVVGREFKMTRDDGSGWFRAIAWDGNANMEKYTLIAADDDQEYQGTPGSRNGEYFMDSIIVHGTAIGDYDLYFENRFTVDPGHAARPPQLFDVDSNAKVYANNLDLPGFTHFSNAWRDDGVGFNVPFVINVTPEPTSLGLLAIGGLALLRRRK